MGAPDSARHGLYIHPNIWHEGVFGARGTQRFFDKQGAVHARVSVDFAREFGCLLEVTLQQLGPPTPPPARIRAAARGEGGGTQ